MLFFSFLKGERKEAVLAPLFKLLEVIFELSVPLAVASLIDDGIAEGNLYHVLMMALLMVVLGILGLISSVTAQYFAARAATGFSRRMKSALFSHIANLAESDRDRIGGSTLISRMTNDSTLVQNGINMFLRLFMRSPFVVFGAAAAAFLVNKELAVIFVIVIPILAFIVFLIMRFTVPMYKRTQSALDKILAKVRENLSGIRVLRAFGKEEAEEKEFSSSLTELVTIQLSTGRISALLNPMTYVVVNLAVAVLVYYGRERFSLGLIEVGSIVALVNYMTQILTELIKLANLIVTISRAVASWKRIKSVFLMDSSLLDKADGCMEGDDSDEAVSFHSVSVVYREGGEPSLKDADFTIRRGERVGIIGGTGSGKTTLVSLIPRLYEAASGSVSVFGHAVQDWNLHSLRSIIGYVQQKALLFKGTVRDNIAWGKPDASDEDVISALKAAEAYDFVMEKKGGIMAFVEEGGKNFSGGQRQRLSIARALIREPEILILDDSSSALDYATEARLRHNLQSRNDMTVITVSQRAGSLMSMDRIFVLDRGMIVASGTHEELLAECSIYQEIYQSQFGGQYGEK